MVVFASFAFVGCQTAHNEHAKPIQWEYAASDFPTSNLSMAMSAMNELSADGWVLDQAIPIKGINGEDEIRYISKRPKH